VTAGEIALPTTAHLFRHGESWLLREDEGSYLRLRPSALPTGVRSRRTESSVLLDPVGHGLASALTARLPAPVREPPTAVGVDGDGVLADLLREALGSRLATSKQATVVVSLSDGAAPQAWHATEDELRERRIPWHRAHIEAGVAHLGPLTRWGETAGHRDLLRRRRAAAADHLVLDSFLASLPADEPIPVALRHLVIGLLLADIDGPASPDLRLVWPIGTVRAHPVLPWPEGLQVHAIP
jgi:hypothetical protein